MITTLVKHAHQDKLKTQETKTDVWLLTAAQEIKFNFHMTQDHVVDARPAHGQNNNQIHQELFVLIDH